MTIIELLRLVDDIDPILLANEKLLQMEDVKNNLTLNLSSEIVLLNEDIEGWGRRLGLAVNPLNLIHTRGDDDLTPEEIAEFKEVIEKLKTKLKNSKTLEHQRIADSFIANILRFKKLDEDAIDKMDEYDISKFIASTLDLTDTITHRNHTKKRRIHDTIELLNSAAKRYHNEPVVLLTELVTGHYYSNAIYPEKNGSHIKDLFDTYTANLKSYMIDNINTLQFERAQPVRFVKNLPKGVCPQHATKLRGAYLRQQRLNEIEIELKSLFYIYVARLESIVETINARQLFRDNGYQYLASYMYGGNNHQMLSLKHFGDLRIKAYNLQRGNPTWD